MRQRHDLPGGDLGRIRRQSVYLDPAKGRQLYDALRTDAVADYPVGADAAANQVDDVH